MGRLGRPRLRAPVPLRRAGRGGRRAGRGAAARPPPADDTVLDRLDAVVFAGGADLDPGLYGEAPHAETTGLRPERDAAEVPLMRAALRRDLPVLGICRGMQLLSVLRGGSLVQHLPEAVGHERHRPAPGSTGCTRCGSSRAAGRTASSATGSACRRTTTRVWPRRAT